MPVLHRSPTRFRAPSGACPTAPAGGGREDRAHPAGRPPPRRLLAPFLLAALLPLALATAVPPEAAAQGEGAPPGAAALPPRILWVWERPEDLRFLEPERDGVAVLVATVEVPAEGGLRVRGRRHPLALPAGLARVAVTRVEVERGAALEGPGREDLVERIAAAIAATADPATSPVRWDGVQVDFDARLSERPFYAALLHDLRRRLGDTPLTITALASWCLGDPWIVGLPIDDAVPMLFRMGIDEGKVRNHLDGGGDFRLPACRHSLGLSTDEPWPALPGGSESGGAEAPRRLYLFHPRAWTAAALAAVHGAASPEAVAGTADGTADGGAGTEPGRPGDR